MRLENPVFSSNFVAYVSGDAVFCFNTPKISVLSDTTRQFSPESPVFCEIWRLKK
jgi:hypothetical protein